jgi:hypothetical protein
MSSSKIKVPETIQSRVIKDSVYNAHRSIVRFLQVFFSRRPVGDLRWLGDENGMENSEETEIQITGQRPDSIEAPHRRPLISVVRGQAMWANTSYNALREGHFSNDDRMFSDMVNMNVVINCLSREDVEAQYIAWLTFLAFRLFKAPLQKYGRIHGVGNTMSMGPTTQSGIKGFSMVQVNVPIFVPSTVRVTLSDEADFQVILQDATVDVS